MQLKRAEKSILLKVFSIVLLGHILFFLLLVFLKEEKACVKDSLVIRKKIKLHPKLPPMVEKAEKCVVAKQSEPVRSAPVVKTFPKKVIPQKTTKPVPKPKKVEAVKQVTKTKEAALKEVVSFLSIQNKENQEIKYQEEVVGYLRKNLCFPDYGMVEVKLVVNEEGKVLYIDVLQTESKKNKKYIQEMLPTLRFPKYTFSKEKNYTLVLQLTNE